MSHDKLVADVVAAAGGEIVGRIRLQKIIYLLDQLGLDAKASFHYHHYGPYSRLIDSAVEKAKAFHHLIEHTRYRNSDGASFSVFQLDGHMDISANGSLSFQEMCLLISRMKRETSTVLELAATIYWLRYTEEICDWRYELIRRKGAKTQDGRVESALALLSDLRLSPTQNSHYLP